MTDLYDTRFAQNVDKALREEIERQFQIYRTGSLIKRDSASVTGMLAAEHMGKISGLEQALKIMQQVHKDMNTRKERKDGENG